MGFIRSRRQRRSQQAVTDQVRVLRAQWGQGVLQGRASAVEAETRATMDSCAGLPERDEIRLAAWESRLLALVTLGRHEAAETEYPRLTAELVARHGNSGLVVLKSRSDRAQNLVYLGRYQEAERECQAVHALGRNVDGPPGVVLRCAVANAMAMALHYLGRHDEAEAAARAATEEMTRAGEAHLRMLRILQVNLARVLCARDRFDEAHRIVSGLECAVPTDRAALRSVSAVALLGLGRHEEAEAAAREAVTICEWGLSAVHHRALEAGTVLGSVLAAQGRLPEAERRLATNSAAWDEHFGPDHPRAVAARAALVDVRHRLGATQGSGPA